ncbi:MAG: hypothetical protein ACI87A_001692, partial [Planctomycetota bacterium]
ATFVAVFGAPLVLGQSAIPNDVSASDWSSIRDAASASRYLVYEHESGFEAHNPGQAWRATFDRRGFLVEPYADDWSWGLELIRFGFAGEASEIRNAAIANAEGGRVFYKWSSELEEWFVNDERGLEHGYTLHSRPLSNPSDVNSVSEKPTLSFDLRVRGGLEPVIQSGRKEVRFVDQNDTTLLNYSGLTVFDADGVTLDSWFELGPEGLRLSIDEADARYPVTIDPVVQQAYLKASNTDAGDNFGDAVAVSGNTIVVGARFESSNATGVDGDQSKNGFFGSGAVYVFVKSGSTWTQQAYLKASNTHSAARFGSSVAISGDTLVVGAEFERHSGSGVGADQVICCASRSGSAYVFVRNGLVWSQEAYLKASNAGASDEFGGAIAIEGDTIVVGASVESSNATGVNGNEADDSAFRTGAAYVFNRTGSTWTQQAYLKASNAQASDSFGISVSISGETIVVGATGESSNATNVNGNQFNNASNQGGAAYVFIRTGSTWTQQAYLKPFDTDPQDIFGNSVSVSGDIIIVGASGEDGGATGVNGDPTDNSRPGSGAAYIYSRDGSTWFARAYLKASNPDQGDTFGGVVAIDGTDAFVGARSEDSGANGINGNELNNGASEAGAVYVFSGIGTFWGQQAYLKAHNSGVRDQFGWSLAYADNTLVVGAYEEESISTGVDGNASNNNAPESGAAYAFNIPAGLTADVLRVELTTGGQQNLSLDGGLFRANWFYFMFGSVTGTSPGLDFGNEVILPLNFDVYLNLILKKPGLSPFGNFIGQLDANGVALASFSLPPGSDPALAGVVLHHAYLAASSLGSAEYASNAVIVTLSL